MAQCIPPSPHSTSVLGSILSLSYCLYGVSRVLTVSSWVSSGMSGFLPILRNLTVGGIGFSKLPQVWICACIMPWDGLVYPNVHGYIPHPNQDKVMSAWDVCNFIMVFIRDSIPVSIGGYWQKKIGVSDISENIESCNKWQHLELIILMKRLDCFLLGLILLY